jgi:hypothetical protein
LAALAPMSASLTFTSALPPKPAVNREVSSRPELTLSGRGEGSYPRSKLYREAETQDELLNSLTYAISWVIS